MDQRNTNNFKGRSAWKTFLFYLGSLAIFISASALTENFPQPWNNLVLGSITAFATLAATFLFLRWEAIKATEVGLSAEKHTLTRTITGFLTGAFLALLLPCISLMWGHVNLVFTPERVSPASIATALLLYFLLSARETLVFHAYPLFNLNKMLGLWPSLVITAIFFCLEHRAGDSTWIGAISAGLGSLLFAITALSSRGLALPLSIHAAWNFTQTLLGYRGNSGLFKLVVEKGYEAEVENVALIGYFLIMSSAFLTFYYYKSEKLLAVE